MNNSLTGIQLLQNARSNKGTAFTPEERETLGLKGLLPHYVSSMDNQIQRVLKNLARKDSDIERYIYLSGLVGRNERLFYRLVIEHINELMPIIYTPTVGQACQEFAQIFRDTRGLYITSEDAGSVQTIVDNWPDDNVRLIVVSDGQRILGLGDLGANGMGIPIGKLALYTACAGIPPEQCLPVMIDVGTNNTEIREHPEYLGINQERVQGEPYESLVDEFVTAIKTRYPKALIQFEDFLTPNAFMLLEKYQYETLCFNDDIQGTASVALAGVYASSRLSNIDFKDLKIMFLGAGSAATGMADLMCSALQRTGLTEEEARKRLWFVDSQGLVVNSRDSLASHKRPYAHEHEACDILTAIDSIKPNVLIGATGSAGAFSQEIIQLMAKVNERPTIFALSNPTSKAECSAEQAYDWSEGRAIFASGSPFDVVEYQGTTFKPGQGNNAYVFPGIGLGAIACEAKYLPEATFLTAAKTLADLVSQESLDTGTLYPPLMDIRDISIAIAVAVAEELDSLGLADKPVSDTLEQEIRDYMYKPVY